MSTISPAAKQICEDNYTSNCGRCPLRSACVQSVGPGREAYDRWIAEVMELADQLTVGKEITHAI